MLFLYSTIGWAPGICPASSAPERMTSSPAFSQRTTSRGVVTSGLENSGWAWST